jgi:8-oxo-dGTP pyrophosphatase MutT (NUDIX family)
VAWSSTPIAHAAASGTGPTTGATTAAIDTTGAKFLIVGSGNFVSSGTLNLTDSKGNTWIKLPLEAGASNARATLWYCSNPTVGTGHTFTLVGTNGYVSFAVAAFGAAATGATPFGAVAAVGAPATSPFTNTVVAPLADGALIVTVAGLATTAQTLTISAPFAISDQKPWVNGQCQGVGLGYLVQGAHTGAAAAWSWPGGAIDFGTLAVAFMEAGSIPLVLQDTQAPRLVVTPGTPTLPITQAPRLVVAQLCDLRVTAAFAEIALKVPSDLRASQVVAEIAIRETAEELRITQVLAEIAILPPPSFQITQAARLVVHPVAAAGVNLTQAARLAALEILSPVNLTQAPRVVPHTIDLAGTAPARASQLARLVVMGPAGAQCFGGAVPQLPDPLDGTIFAGLGPHEDRFFLELELDEGLETWALHDPMNDPPTLAAHAGRKDGRLIDAGAIIRRTTDRLGGWQTSGATWTADDHDRRIRGLIAAGHWFNREFRAYVATRGDVAAARCLGRFILRDYPPGAELVVAAEGVDLLGSEFSPFSLDRDVLGSVLFDATRTPNAPPELLTAKRPIPIYMGTWSDESSGAEGVPTWRSYPLRGGGVSSTDGLNGYGDMVSSATPPTVVTATALPGGTLDPTVINSEYGFMVTAIDAAGRESDPYPFHCYANFGGTRGRFPDSVSTIYGVQPVPKATLDGSGTQKIRVEWSGATGAVKYRCYLGAFYYLARYSHYLETAATYCEFTSLGAALPATFTGPNIWYYVVIAKLEDGLTGQSFELTAVETGPRRIVRGWFTPMAGAVEYLVARRGTVGGFTRLFHVPASQLEGGYVYFDDPQDATTGDTITELPTPKGMIPLVDIGDETIAGATWGKFALARWAWHKILGVYAGGARLAAADPNVLHPDKTGWPFPAKTRPLGDCDCTVIYLKGATLTAHRAGTAVVQVNGCTTEDVGDGAGSTITQAARGAQHLITELVLNDHKAGIWTGIPAFDDGTPQIRSSSYAHAEAVQVARVGGNGYTMRLVLDGPTPLRELLQKLVQSFGLHHGINRHGQIVAGHYDDAVDPERVYPLFTDAREIVGDLTITPKTSELETTIPYSHTYRAIEKSYLVTDAVIEDTAAIADNRGKPKVGPARVLPYTADATTIADVMTRTLMLGRSVRQWIEIPLAIEGLNVDVFDVVRITDEAGLGVLGYQEAYVLVLEHEVRPPDFRSSRPLTVAIRGLDITALLDTAWSWGPDTLITWDSMTADERGTYGAWASDADVIPSDNTAAKEWR